MTDNRAEQLERVLYPAAPRLFLFTLGVTLLSMVVLPGLGVKLPDFSEYLRTAGFNGVNMAGLMGIFVLFLCGQPTSTQTQALLVIAMVMEGFIYSQRPPEMSPLQRLDVMGLGFGIAGLVGLCLLAMQRRGQMRNRLLGLLSVAGILLLYGSLSVVFLSFLSYLTPFVFDAFIYHVELAQGTPVPFVVARMLETHPILGQLSMAIYVRLTLFVAIGFYLNLRFPDAATGNLMAGFLIALFVCFPLYLILPMVGIDMFVGAPPWPLGPAPTDFAIKWVEAPAWLPRTCAPSLHAAWVYLFFFSVYRINWRVAAPAFLIVGFTLLGTMSKTVGHYFLDIVLAFPLAVAIQAAVTFPTRRNHRLRKTVACAGLGYTVLSCLTLRLAPLAVAGGIRFFWVAQMLILIAFARAEYKLGRLTLRTS